MRSFLIFFVTTLILAPSAVFAQKYLVDLPIGNDPSFDKYINMLYKMSISVAALLAVVKIIIAGAKYMLSDVVTQKSDAKSDIKGAILGLLLILGAVIILETINPMLTNGGLRITKLERKSLDVGAASIRTVGGQTGDEVASVLAQGLPACASTADLGNSESGKYKLSRLTADGCNDEDKQTALATFSSNCTSNGGTLNGSNTYECKTELASPAPYEFAMGSYDDSHNFCSFGQTALTTLIPGTIVACYHEVVLTAGDTQTSGNIMTYDATKTCKDEISESISDEVLAECLEVVQDLLFETCSVQGGSTCDSGWCTHNAGKRENVGAGKFGCRLPTKRFTNTEVQTSYSNSTPSGEQTGTFNAESFRSGCTALGGTAADIKLEYGDELNNLRCVLY